MNVDNPPDDGGGSGEAENVEDAGTLAEAKETDASFDAVLDAIAAISAKITALFDRMDAFVDAGATVRETDVDESDVEDADEMDLETPIEDMDFSLDAEDND